MTTPITLVALAGSLRAGSFNNALIRAAAELAPEGVTVTPYDYSDVPLYNGDIDNDDDRPAAVLRLKAAINAADGLLIATPEYNYGVPGVLKNAIDWASRPGYRSPLAHKPVAVASASMSFVGGARALGQLKQVLLGVLSEVYPAPEYLLASAHNKVVDGRLVDEASREHLSRLVSGFAGWVRARKG